MNKKSKNQLVCKNMQKLGVWNPGKLQCVSCLLFKDNRKASSGKGQEGFAMDPADQPTICSKPCL